MSALSPGLRAFTFAPPRLPLRPAALRRVGDAAGERVRDGDERAAGVRSRWRTTASSPSTRPRSAASSGCRATVAAPMRLAILASFAKLSFRSQGEAGERSRSRPSAGRGSTSGSGTRGRPSASARAEASSTRPLGVGKRRSANWTTGSSAIGNGPLGRERGEVLADARPLEQRVDERRRRSRRAPAPGSPSRAARRRKISMFGSASPERLGRLDLGREREVEVGGDEVVELEEARGRQHEVGEVGRVGREEVDGDGEEVLAAKRLVQPRLLRIRGGDVDVPAEERLRSRRDPRGGPRGPCG